MYLIGIVCSVYLFGVVDLLIVLIVVGMLLFFFNLGVWGVLYVYIFE